MSAKNANSDSVAKIPFIGATGAKKFERLGVKTVEDLFNFLPREVVDLTHTLKISEAKSKIGEKVIICAKIKSSSIIRSPRKKIWIVGALLQDDSGLIEALWFNQPYLHRSLKKGKEYLFYGEIEFDKSTERIYLNNPEIYPEAGLYPIYPQTKNLTSRQISRALTLALQKGYQLNEYLPEQIIKKYNLPSLPEAVKNLHFPKNLSDFRKAKSRFIFNQLLNLILANLFLKNQNKKKKAPKIIVDKKLLNRFVNLLPFDLTASQKKVISEIFEDLQKPYPMNRLVQGDVGSGKTVVALVGALMVINSKYKVAWLAPTDILARQHFQTALKLLKNFDVKIGLVTSATKRRLKKVETDNWQLAADLIIGTHALLQKDVEIKDLGLVIVDEQHRFGVAQRAALAESKKLTPHFLSLSATPIPRTLAHIVFGNLDISQIREKPAERLPVKTFLIPESKRADAYRFIDERIEAGEQVFVICPLIQTGDESDISEKKTIMSEFENLKKTILGKRRIAFLHGQMKSNEKEEIIAKMLRGEIDILVSTSVIEVGIDIKKATVMIIEDADRFGLSQLHQFRGRIGRSNLQSYCFCFTSAFAQKDKGYRKISSETQLPQGATSENSFKHSKKLKAETDQRTRERLKAFVQNSDGFALAELDLKLRGPGALLGEEQSGFKGINPLWFENTQILADASNAAKDLISKLDENLILKNKVFSYLEVEHLE